MFLVKEIVIQDLEMLYNIYRSHSAHSALKGVHLKISSIWCTSHHQIVIWICSDLSSTTKMKTNIETEMLSSSIWYKRAH